MDLVKLNARVMEIWQPLDEHEVSRRYLKIIAEHGKPTPKDAEISMTFFIKSAIDQLRPEIIQFPHQENDVTASIDRAIDRLECIQSRSRAEFDALADPELRKNSVDLADILEKAKSALLMSETNIYTDLIDGKSTKIRAEVTSTIGSRIRQIAAEVQMD